MTTPILMPQLGNEITEAEVTEWLKAEGDEVTEGDLIVVITTTKMSLEIEAPATGVLKSIDVPEGELAEVGATLATIGQP
ncbi:lipoyl domain-containing protein [Shinella daejeonensis]|uniref:lipoyl domain-containing protein n=1 Tax=Shinella daejeonensis TaxID=659017 RepID=UPI0020C75180|nr:lipoyl domain-containing protein [Shinella daejeonensis]MCP8897124.1 lipoyl domain-containing protein [Shinella daejeonensis]